MIKLNLKAAHFKKAKFGSILNGPIARALKSRYPDAIIMEGVYSTYMNGTVYWHEPYTVEEFEKDKKKASNLLYLGIFRIRKLKLDENDKGRMDTYFHEYGNTD